MPTKGIEDLIRHLEDWSVLSEPPPLDSYLSGPDWSEFVDLPALRRLQVEDPDLVGTVPLVGGSRLEFDVYRERWVLHEPDQRDPVVV